jgi:hypothetical protein
VLHSGTGVDATQDLRDAISEMAARVRDVPEQVRALERH